MYLGGNGFYWRIAYHRTEPHAIEMRRGMTGHAHLGGRSGRKRRSPSRASVLDLAQQRPSAAAPGRCRLRRGRCFTLLLALSMGSRRPRLPGLRLG
jgi:hypothetical protein